jgi:predicted TIM-barrel fold metal-dependent hydrolase
MSQEALDLFCHWLPKAFCEAANRAAARPLHMFARAQKISAMVDLDARFRVMDQFPGYQQVPSLASPTLEMIARPDQTPDLARLANDEMARTVANHGERFASFVAALPLNNPEAALQEAERAVDQLGAAGVQIFTSINGRPVDEPEILQLFELMAAKKMPVWLHPIRSMTTPDYPAEKVSKFDLWWAFGWPHETSLAMGRLVFSGIFDRWPDFAVITHHVGGTTAMMSGRLGSGLDLLGTRVLPGEENAIKTPLRQRPLDAFKKFYADTASFGSRAAIECGRAFFGIERLVFATDMPFDPEQGPGYIRETLRAISEMNLADEEREAILFGNAHRILAREGQRSRQDA